MATKYKLVKTPKSVITEEYLVELGFKKNRVTAKMSYPEDPFHYYTFNPVKNSSICLISNDNDDALVKNWNVSFFEDDKLIITDKKVLKKLIEALKGMTLIKKRR